MNLEKKHLGKDTHAQFKTVSPLDTVYSWTASAADGGQPGAWQAAAGAAWRLGNYSVSERLWLPQ